MKSVGQNKLRLIGCSDLADVIRSQFRASLSLASVVTAFVDHVLDVVALAAQEQMRRVDAGWVVAIVQDMLVVRDWAIEKLENEPMCLVAVQFPIAVRVSRPAPLPAFVALGEAGDQDTDLVVGPTLLGWLGRFTSAGAGAKPLLQDGATVERPSALDADTRHLRDRQMAVYCWEVPYGYC